MALANGAAAAIEPYQPIPGLPVREQMARAHDHYGGRFSKLMQKHSALREVASTLENKLQAKAADEEVRAASWKRQAASAGVQLGVAAATGTILGVMDGRFGGEKGYVSKWGVPLDGATALAGCTGALLSYFFSDKPLLTTGLGALGVGGTGAFLHRHGKDVGVAWLEKGVAGEAISSTGATAQNGAKGGVVYHATPAPPQRHQ